VYEFILRVAGMTNFKSTLGTQLKQIHYAYLKAVDFFPVMVNNLCRVKHDKLTALKPKDILDLEAMLKRYYAEKKKHPIASGQQQHTGIARNSSLYKYR
jgi:ABC-type proline/glycine betaine transport system ATPase subunit